MPLSLRGLVQRARRLVEEQARGPRGDLVVSLSASSGQMKEVVSQTAEWLSNFPSFKGAHEP